MAKCPHCGKNNKDGSLFCQSCGRKMSDASPSKPLAAASAGGNTCPSCGTVNPPGMNFCKMCGTALARLGTGPTAAAGGTVPTAASGSVSASHSAASAGHSSTGSQSTRITCPACAKATPQGFAFCQHCGSRLGGAKSVDAMAATMHASPTPPAGVRPAGFPSPDPFLAREARGGTGGTGETPPAVAAAAPQTSQVVEIIARPTDTVSAVYGSLVVLRRDGTDGDLYPLTGDSVDVGRTEGALVFGDDPFLADRHARFVCEDGVVRVRPLDNVNGVYLRLREPFDVAPGDSILLGKELLRYEPLLPEERDPPSLVEHGVRLLGTAPREAWGRLRQITGAGTTRDVWHLVRPEFVLGREEGDVTFPDDEFMSRRHCAVSNRGGTVQVEDQGSSNGTFVRLRGEHLLAHGDVIRMGDQLLRFEAGL